MSAESVTLFQRKVAEEDRAYDDRFFLGAKSVDGLRILLTSKFGSVVAGWFGD